MPGIMQLVQVAKTPVRIQSFMVTNDEVMLVNPDIVNNIFIGNDPGSQLISVPALGSITLNTKDHDLWVSTNGGNYTVNAYLLPNGSNWVPSPAQVAAQINALGLAKDTTVQSTNTALATTNSNTGTTATNTATTATNVNTVNTTLGSPSQSQDVKNLTTGGNPGGIPVLRGTDNLGTASAQTIAANTNATLINGVSVTKPGFEAVFQLNLPAGVGTVPFAILQVIWQDSNTGLQVGLKQYVLTTGNGPSNPIIVYLSGPCRGNQIVLKLRNQDPAQTLTYTYAFNQTAHTYLVDRLLQPTYAATAPITFSNTGGDPSKGLLASSSASIAPNGNYTRLIACCNYKVKISIDNTVQLNAVALLLNTPSSTGLYLESNPPTTVLRMSAAVGAQANQEWQMPNGAMVFQVFNQGGTNTVTPNIAITLMEY